MSDHVKLSEVCEILNSNVDKKIKENEQKVKLCNFTDVYNNWAITKYTSKKFMKATATQNEINKFSLKKGYVAITKDSETKDDIGISTYIADNFDNVLLGYHCTLLKPNQKVLNGKFLNAYLNSFYGRKYFSNCASGSGQRYTLTIDTIKDLNIPLINIETQQKIARTLSVLDQKIENNHKINELLHKILELLYEQYFVRFDFLDENNKPYQTSGGKMKFSKELNRLIPSGWSVRFLNHKIVSTYQPKTISKTLLNDSYSYSVYGGGGIIGRFTEYNHEQSEFIISCRGQCGISYLTLPKSWITGNAMVIRPTKSYTSKTYLYHTIKKYKLTNYITGSVQPQITRQNLSTMPILIPKRKILNKWNNISSLLWNLIHNNMQSTQTLTALRDFLLPLLLKQQVKPKQKIL
ncbi:type I R-M system S protein [Helicobacter pylori Hp P-16]|uniref:restriction endonuclease subunit S n=1 Tax=Helicobacter pylori TaxID=210 RepID=UPI00026AFCF0|nr:restriction endonuclease subunit S [Helicobacter pylori]EJC13573.1 type I R-M system S protein [Helicobacter pylori Hp P-16]